MMPPRLQMGFAAFGELLGATFAFAISYAALLQMVHNYANSYISDTLRFLTFPFFGIESACMFIFGLELLYDTILFAIGIFNKDVANEMAKLYI
jgi:hypothetical protein